MPARLQFIKSQSHKENRRFESLRSGDIRVSRREGLVAEEAHVTGDARVSNQFRDAREIQLHCHRTGK